MRAAILPEQGAAVAVVDDVAVDEPRSGEALVALEAAGVCHTDLTLREGGMPYPTPLLLGHEAAGRIIALGPDTQGPAPGRRVVLWMRPPCRECDACRRDEAGLCEASGAMSASGTLPDGRTSFSRGGEPLYRALGIGGFTEQIVMPVSGLVCVSEDIPAEVAALLGCGVATGAGAVLNVADVEPGEVVLVFGGGGVGLAAAFTAVALGASAVVLVDPSAERRERAAALGLEHVIAGGDRAALREQLGDAIGRTSVDVAVDAVGKPALVELGWRTVRQGGTVVAVGVAPADETVTLPAQVLALSQRRILGCFMGGIDPHRDIPVLCDLYRRGELPLDGFVTGHRPLAEVPQALEDLAAARGLRTIIDVGAESPVDTASG